MNLIHMGTLAALLGSVSVCNLAFSADAESIAVTGYHTGNYLIKNLLDPAGVAATNRIENPPARSEYPDFSAIIWDDSIDDVNVLDAGVLWDTSADVEEVANWVRGGGRLVVTGSALPVAVKQVRVLGPAKELVGIDGIVKSDVVGKVIITEPEDPIFAGLEIPEDGFDWASGYSRVASGASFGKVLAVARDEAGNERPFITVTEHGDGKVYWLGASPMRLGQSDRPEADRMAYDVVVLRALGLDPELPSLSSGPSAAEASGWGLVPLGQPGHLTGSGTNKPPKDVKPLRIESEMEGEPVTLIENGEARSIIALADDAPPATKNAATLLQHMISEATGVTLKIRSIDGLKLEASNLPMDPDDPKISSAIIVGDSKLGHEAGIHASELPEEGFHIETKDRFVFIVGKDTNAKDVETFGTRFGVVDFLESQLGIRWLWPGDLGTVIPKTADLTIRPIKVTDAPLLAIRKLRNLGGSGAAYHADQIRGVSEELLRFPKEEEISGFTKRINDGLQRIGVPFHDYSKSHSVVLPWFDLMRLGGHLRVNAGHAFHGWYEKYHKDHPDWFALQPDGTRNQIPVRETLCTSNPGFRKAAARQVLDSMEADPSLDGWSVSLNDGGQNIFCMCIACREEDPPNGPEISFRYTLNDRDINVPYVSMTDRVMQYYNAVAEEVAAVRPDALIGGQAYSYYRTPPVATVLHPSLLISFVGFSYLDQSRHQSDLASWDAWANSATNILLRPNTLHTGHGFPAVFVTRLGKDLTHCLKTGMIGADFDSVMHHWSTQGLNYYVLAKLLWNPLADPKAIVRDYCESAFGPAADDLIEYFDRIEAISDQVSETVGTAVETALRDEEELNAARFALNQQVIEFAKSYSPETVAELRTILDRAKAKAGSSPEIQARIDFIGRGLDYAAVQNTFYAENTAGRGKAALEARQEALRDLFYADYLAVNVGIVLWRETALLESLSAAQ